MTGVVLNVVVFHPFSKHSDFWGVLLMASYSKTEGDAKVQSLNHSLQKSEFECIVFQNKIKFYIH